ncbi:hypothetical protein LshimejAT787_0304840 [Lyophyllum shimeji]|uniref:Uncharacterized protein n=1 Tax=Lyophyllum shimeji TaxID=47721 RepID=A0A9P3PIU2_LYOSH|nr:hypothetical protein LshimejAT787_0304840 [Lyophyllum shimeji]
MAFTASSSDIETDHRGMSSPEPWTTLLLDATADIYDDTGFEPPKRDVVTRELTVDGATFAYSASSTVGCSQDAWSPAPYGASPAATPTWITSTSPGSLHSPLASPPKIGVGQPFSPSPYPLIAYLTNFPIKAPFTSCGISDSGDCLSAVPSASGSPNSAPPTGWNTVYSNPACPATALAPSNASSHSKPAASCAIPECSESPSHPSSNISNTSNVPWLTTSSLRHTLSSVTPSSPTCIPPLASRSRTTTLSNPYTLTSFLPLPSSTSLKTFTHLPVTSRSSTRRYESGTSASSIGTGVLSTDNPKGPDGFASNTAAIVAVAIAGTISIIVAVVAIFYACKRYKKRRARGASSPSVLHFHPWHPPLAGDDDNQYYTDHRGGLVTASSGQHLESDTHSGEMTHTGTEHLSPVRSTAHGAGSTDGGVSPLTRNMSFGHQSSVSTYGADMTLPFPSTPYGSSAPPPTAWPGPLGDTARQHDEVGDGAPSLHADPFSKGHTAASSSSHGKLPARALSPGSSTCRDFVGRLRRGRSSLPDIVVHGASSKSSSRESITSNDIPPTPSRAMSSLARPIRSTYGSPMGSGFWTPDTLPPVPSPTATENSRTFEDLLTPHLGVQRTSSEYSSLRDNVDYSRPISGLVRNRVHSTVTFQTEDTATMVDAST